VWAGVNRVDHPGAIRDARQTLAIVVAIALLLSVQLSLFLARTIVQPLRALVRAAVRVRLGRERDVIVPRLPERGDEIGLLARAFSDMASALRQRIDAGEAFAADVSHEIKNPLASLRSALEALEKVDDPKLRRELQAVAAHDVRRIDRLVTEIADASRLDAELSRARMEPVDLAAIARRYAAERDARLTGERVVCASRVAQIRSKSAAPTHTPSHDPHSRIGRSPSVTCANGPWHPGQTPVEGSGAAREVRAPHLGQNADP